MESMLLKQNHELVQKCIECKVRKKIGKCVHLFTERSVLVFVETICDPASASFDFVSAIVYPGIISLIQVAKKMHRWISLPSFYRQLLLKPTPSRLFPPAMSFFQTRLIYIRTQLKSSSQVNSWLNVEFYSLWLSTEWLYLVQYYVLSHYFAAGRRRTRYCCLNIRVQRV